MQFVEQRIVAQQDEVKELTMVIKSAMYHNMLAMERVDLNIQH